MNREIRSMMQRFGLSIFESIVLLLTVISQSSALAAKNQVAVGTAKMDVTPAGPVVLAGYGGRSGEHEGIDQRLWARALVIGETNPVAIIVLDSCGVPGDITNAVARRLSHHDIPREHLVVAATHTHNAPALDGYAPIVWAGRTTAEQEQHVHDYTEFAVDRMVAAVESALTAREPMTLEWTRGRVNFGGNRRVLNDGKWKGFGFQRNGPVDHSLPVLAARDSGGRVRAVWANYACHCTTVGSRNRVGGDWAGFANESIEVAFPHAVSLMTIGCGADVGPQPSGSLEVAAQHGRTIATEVRRVLSEKTSQLTSPPKVRSRKIRLPLDASQSREFWDEQLRRGGYHQQLAKMIVSKLEDTGTVPDHVSYPISAWLFGDDLAIVFLGGEVVVDYAVRLNRELDWSRLWVTAWANDMPGYIPSRRILAEGGYEPDFSQVYYAQPGRYRPEVEERLVGSVRQLLPDSFVAAADQIPAPFHSLPTHEPAAFQRLATWAAGEKPPEQQEVLRLVRRVLGTATPAVAEIDRQTGERAEWYNFAGDFTKRAFVRQESKGTLLRWQSPVLEKANSDFVDLCFAGGVGWISQPQTEGFLLNAADSGVRFDVTLEPARWVSQDRKLELLYLPCWTSDVDSAGFFFLRVESAAVPSGQPLVVEVRSLGEGSKRWFSIELEQKIPDRLEELRTALGGDKHER